MSASVGINYANWMTEKFGEFFMGCKVVNGEWLCLYSWTIDLSYLDINFEVRS